MSSRTHVSLAAGMLLLSGALTLSVALAEEKAPAAGPKVLFENDKVRVIEATTKPGQGSASAERQPRMVRALTAGTIEHTFPDGKTEKIAWKACDVRWFGRETFAVKNIGETDVVLYIVYPK